MPLIAISCRRGRLGRAEPDEQRHAGEGEPMPAPGERQHHTLGEQRARAMPAARAERRADGQLLVPALRADEREVGHVGAGDEQDDGCRPEQRPEHLADVADDIHGERAHVRQQLQVVEHLLREPGGSGNFSISIGSMRATSAFACSSVTPGFNRATPM